MSETAHTSTIRQIPADRGDLYIFEVTGHMNAEDVRRVYATLNDAYDKLGTIDLRVDYLRPARPEKLVGQGRVVRLGNRVGVVELRAFQPSCGDEPVAAGTGVYNIRRSARSMGGDLWHKLLAAAPPR